MKDPEQKIQSVPPEVLIPIKKSVANSKKNKLSMVKDTLIAVEINGTTHIISENYSYKSDTYYTILQHERDGKNVKPNTSTVLNAYVVPICLELAKLAGIPVCEWGISQSYVPVPAIIYGLNYFSSSSNFEVVKDSVKAESVIKHVTNMGKYHFCYQRLLDDETIHSSIAIFGETTKKCEGISDMSKRIYELFGLPLVTIVFVKKGDKYYLSSLSPTRYTQLSADDRDFLAASITKSEGL